MSTMREPARWPDADTRTLVEQLEQTVEIKKRIIIAVEKGGLRAVDITVHAPISGKSSWRAEIAFEFRYEELFER